MAFLIVVRMKNHTRANQSQQRDALLQETESVTMGYRLYSQCQKL
jgi:hypothetical protein